MRVGSMSLVTGLTMAWAGFASTSGAHAETLEDALRATSANNPTLHAARESARSAQQGVAVARSNFLPSLVFGADAGRSVGESAGTTIVGGVTPVPRETTQRQYNYSLDVTLNQDLWTSGRNSGLLGQAKARSKAAYADLVGTEQDIALQAITAYVNVRRDIEAVQISANNLALLDRRSEEARQRFKVGDVTRTDVAQAEARFSGAQAQLAQAQASLEASKAIYAEIIGTIPGELESPRDVARIVPQSLDEALETARDRNPGIVSAEFALRQAESALKVARAGYLPQVGLSGQINRDRTNGENVNRLSGVINDFSNSARGSAITGRLTFPIYDGGLARAQTRGAKADIEVASARVEERRRDVQQRATAAWANYQAALSVIASSRKQVEANTLALQGAEQEQRVGLRTTLDVLNTQQDLLNSQLNLINAERDAYVSAHTLMAIVGVLDAKTLGLENGGS